MPCVFSLATERFTDALRQRIGQEHNRGDDETDGGAGKVGVGFVGRRFGVRELSEFASSIERQGLQGVSISATVASLAASMRAKALDELEREADKANANLSGPTIGFVVTTIVFLAYPLTQCISEVFGG